MRTDHDAPTPQPRRITRGSPFLPLVDPLPNIHNDDKTNDSGAMRFLRTDLINGLRFEELDHRDPRDDRGRPVRYAILSHRWGKDEVLLEDVLNVAGE